MIRTWLGLTAMALLLTVSPDPAGLQSGPSSAKFRPHPGGLSSYLVVLNNAAAGPRGSSHASSIAQDLQSRNGIESVLVSEWAWDMFSIRASEAIARRVSDDPRVK